MCGILGYSGEPAEDQWGETYRLLESLFLASEPRGRHATGFVAKTQPYKRPTSGGIFLDKRPVAASAFVGNLSWRSLRRRRCTAVIGHVRWATHGPPEVNANNHPHRGRRDLYLVHNGVLTDYQHLCERKGLMLRTDCDSEAILRVVESSRTPTSGLSAALQGFRGSMAVAVYDGCADTTYLARNDGRPLWLARLRHDRRWFYASTQEILLSAFRDVLGRRASKQIDVLMPLAANQVHILNSDGRLIAQPVPYDRRHS